MNKYLVRQECHARVMLTCLSALSGLANPFYCSVIISRKDMTFWVTGSLRPKKRKWANNRKLSSLFLAYPIVTSVYDSHVTGIEGYKRRQQTLIIDENRWTFLFLLRQRILQNEPFHGEFLISRFEHFSSFTHETVDSRGYIWSCLIDIGHWCFRLRWTSAAWET